MVRNTDFIGFTFNGRHSSEFNIYSVSDGSRYQDILVPNPIDYTEQVPGGVGQYYFGSDMDIKEFPLSIAYDKLTETQVRELRNWLAPDAVGELIFDERPYKTYTAKISSSPSLSFICFDSYNKESGRKERIYKGEGSINFVCYYPLGITSGEKKNLGWYREQIDDKIYRNIGGSSSIINYKLENKEIAVLEKIEGKTYQKTSKQGKNLVNISNKILTNQTVNGYSGISDKNLLSILDKTKTYIYSAQIDNTLGTTYSVISLWAVRNDVNERLQTLPTVRIAAGQTGISTVTLNGATFDWTGITALYCGVSINANGENVTITVKRFQFEEGSAATSYEPFVPDSPSPDYPSEIIGAQPTVVTACGRNLLDLSVFTLKSTGSAVYQDGKITVTGANKWAGTALIFDTVFPPAAYCIRTNEANRLISDSDEIPLAAYNEVYDGYGRPYFSYTYMTTLKFTATKPFTVGFICKAGDSVVYPQIEIGSDASPYQPYTGQTIPLPTLAPLYGDGTVNDEYDAATGVETRRWKRVVFDGTENWAASATGTAGKYRVSLSIADILPTATFSKVSSCRCSHYATISADNTYHLQVGISANYGTSHGIFIYDDAYDAQDMTDWKAYLAAQAAAGTPVTVVYQLAEPVITKIEETLPFSNFLPSADSGLIINANPEYYNYFTDSNANISLRLYGAKYSNIDEWAVSTGMIEDLDTTGVNKGYDHYITLPDGSKGIQLFNPGDKDTDFILSFNKPTPMNDILFTLSNGEQFMLNLRSSDTDVEDYGAVSDAEKRIAAMTGGVITIDTKKNRIMYKYGTGENVTEESIYFALKKGQFFKIPKNRTSTGGYNLVIGTTSNIETDSIKISYDYLYY